MAKDYGKTMDAFYVALGTPFKDDMYTVDYDAFRKHVKHYTDCADFIEIGGGIIALPEAGELFSLKREEKRELIKIALEEGKGKLKVVSGVGGTDTREAVIDAKMARDMGVDGLFIMPPVGSEDMVASLDKEKNPYVFLDFAQAIAKEVDLPFIAHAAGSISNIWGIGYPVESSLKMISECRNFVGWKMMYGNPSAYLEVTKAFRKYEKEGGQHVAILCAGAQSYYDMMNNDAMEGSVSCHWNYSRDINIRLIKAWKNNDMQEMKRIWLEDGLRELHSSAGKGNGKHGAMRLHSNFKTLTWLIGEFPNPYVRQPMVQPFKDEVIFFRDLLRSYNMPCISDEEISKVLEKLPR